MKRSICRVFLFLLMLTIPSTVFAQNAPQNPKKLRFGIYAPNTAFSSNSARWSYIKRVASYVQGATGIPCSGRAYARAGSFSGALGSLDFALVDPIYVAMHRGRFRVLATARYGGGARAAWGLFARSGGTFQSLKGKVLVMARAGGAEAAVAEGLLSGEVNVRKFFRKIKIVPDLAAAVQTVRNGGGDAVFAPVAMASGLSKIIPVSSMPNASFVLVNHKLPKALVSKVRSAIYSVGGGAAGGFGGPAAGGVPMGRSKARFLSSFPGVMRFNFKGFLRPFKGSYLRSVIVDSYWRP